MGQIGQKVMAQVLVSTLLLEQGMVPLSFTHSNQSSYLVSLRIAYAPLAILEASKPIFGFACFAHAYDLLPAIAGALFQQP